VRARTVLAAALAALVTGCAVGPNFRRPEVATPEVHRGQEAPETASLADLPWWELFQDPVLRDLVAESLRANRDLATAVARVEQARGFVLVARSEMIPQAGYLGTAERGRTSFQAGAPHATGNAFLGALNAAWEIDLWGRVRRATEAARAELYASEEFRRGVVLSLVAAVAQAYFELRELDRELDIARRTTASFDDTVELFVRQLEGGVGNQLSVSRAQAARAQAAAAISDVERAIVAKENELALLLGRLPSDIPRGAEIEDHALPPETPAGLPSTLLERRPDVREAEQTLRAANARIGVAVADFFPRIGLTALYGGRSNELDLVTTGAASIWSIGASVAGPLFQGGRLIGNLQSSKGDWRAARAQYEQTVLNAFREVSDALVAYDRLRVSRAERARAVTELDDAVRLARTRFLGGLANYFEVLEAQQELFPAENDLARVERDQLVTIVQLYRALGGGWTEAPAVEGELRPEKVDVFPPWP
jgi:multidrug efflux system outer membrane protein